MEREPLSLALEAKKLENTSHVEAKAYIASLIGKSLRIHISDGRMFVGEMKCTDKEMNVILHNTMEYRDSWREGAGQQAPIAAANVTNRFVGLVVIPGAHIHKVELEEFDPSGII